MYTKDLKNIKGIGLIYLIIAILLILIISVVVIVMGNKKEGNTGSSQEISQKSVETKNSDVNSEYDENGDFLMTIEDVFTITGRGTVVTGEIERGTINLKDTVQIIGLNDETKTTVITGIQMSKQNVDTAKIGDKVGLILSNIERTEVQKGQVLAKPNSIKGVSKFDAQLYLLTKEEGGRKTPVFDKYSSQFYFGVTDVKGVVSLPSGTEMVDPGDTANITVELDSPVAMEKGTEFSIKEGGRTIGKGTVTKIY